MASFVREGFRTKRYPLPLRCRGRHFLSLFSHSSDEILIAGFFCQSDGFIQKQTLLRGIVKRGSDTKALTLPSVEFCLC